MKILLADTINGNILVNQDEFDGDLVSIDMFLDCLRDLDGGEYVATLATPESIEAVMQANYTIHN